MAIEALDDIDLVKGTLRDLGRMSFQQVAQSATDYEIFPNWFKEDKVMFSDGIGVQKTLMTRLPDVARHVGWTDKDNTTIVDLLENIQVPWRHATTSWSWKYQETLMNRGKSLITNIIEPRRAGAMINLIEVFESAGWNSPSASTNKTDPFGVAYWVVKNSATGYNGGLPSGHSNIAGLDLADAPNFKNYTGTYSTFDQNDAISKMRTMKRRTKFKSPVDINDYRKGRGERYRVYVNEATISDMEKVALAQNDNLGLKDISRVDYVSLAFNGHPIRYVEYLDGDTTNPIYFVDHSTFYPVCLAGDYLREGNPIPDPERHDWRIVHLDMSYNYICFDRRRNGVIYKV